MNKNFGILPAETSDLFHLLLNPRFQNRKKSGRRGEDLPVGAARQMEGPGCQDGLGWGRCQTTEDRASLPLPAKRPLPVGSSRWMPPLLEPCLGNITGNIIDNLQAWTRNSQGSRQSRDSELVFGGTMSLLREPAPWAIQ